MRASIAGSWYTIRHADLAPVDAGLLRAHAVARDSHAERRPHVAGGQRRRAPSRGRGRPGPGSGAGEADRRTADPRPSTGPGRIVRDDVPATNGVVADPSRAPAEAGGVHRRGRLRSEPGARGVHELSGLGARRDRARRRRDHVPRAVAGDRGRAGRGRHRGSVLSLRRRLRPESRPPRHRSRERRHQASEPRRARAHGLHADRPTDRRRGDVARLHVRLQLLLHHRDARPQLPHVCLRSRPRRHPRCARPRRAGDLPRGR